MSGYPNTDPEGMGWNAPPLKTYKEFTLRSGDVKVNYKGEYSFAGYFSHPKCSLVIGVDAHHMHSELDLVLQVYKRLDEMEVMISKGKVR